MIQIEDLIVDISCSIKESLNVIDNNTKGLCFVADNKKMVGIATDGDIRRALLRGIDINNNIVLAMKDNFVFLTTEDSEKCIRKTFKDYLKIIPILDLNGNIVDYADARHNHLLPVLQPEMLGKEIEYITECIRTNWISSQGKYVNKFENCFQEMHGGYTSLAVSNGTVALQLALEALGIGVGDEVIVPDLTFAATVNAVIHVGATPVLCDVDAKTWVINPDDARLLISTKTKAIIPVHLYGQPCDMTSLVKIACENQLFIVEDCAEALGSRWAGELVGTFGDVATFSFFGNKTITTGEGGMVLFKDADIAKNAAVIRDHGMQPDKKYWHNIVGHNYRMTNLQAAVGVAQMEFIDQILSNKRKIAKIYQQNLKGVECLESTQELDSSSVFHSCWLYTVLIKETHVRDNVIKKLLMNGIESRPVFYPLHSMPPYINFRRGKVENSINISKNGISLPSFASITEDEIIYICDILKKIIHN